MCQAFFYSLSPKVEAKIRLLQFHVTVNHVTTGHKLQGKTVDSLVVGEWIARVKNWICVVLSRVRTLEGVYLLQPLPEVENTAPDPLLLNMLDRFCEKKITHRQDHPNIAAIRSTIPRPPPL